VCVWLRFILCGCVYVCVFNVWVCVCLFCNVFVCFDKCVGVLIICVHVYTVCVLFVMCYVIVSIMFILYLIYLSVLV